jgi:hypothetical protein
VTGAGVGVTGPGVQKEMNVTAPDICRLRHNFFTLGLSIERA